MIEIRQTGDLFTSGAQALVNAVNTIGKSGKGIALEFKKRYPQMQREYENQCKTGKLTVGKVWIWESHFANCQYVVCFPTKQHWANPSKLEWISDGLEDLRNNIIRLKLESIAMPALGCGNGKLPFEAIRSLIESKLDNLNTLVILYEPQA